MNAAGHLYGTTQTGGANGGGNENGTVFELTPNAAKSEWTETVLYSFCARSGNGENCTDGAAPWAGLVMDKAGNLYGTTNNGYDDETNGYDGYGVVFELIPNAAKTKWTEKVLHRFCAGGYPCTDDGANPQAGLLLDAQGRLYGTTKGGGANGEGTAFELTPNPAKTKWTETVLYNFCGQPGCTDGDQPLASLITDSKGNLYSTTDVGGGHNNAGVVFELSPNAAKTKWTETVLHDFCVLGYCRDGVGPAGLIMDPSGHLYGTTGGGGAQASASYGGGGTVFELP